MVALRAVKTDTTSAPQNRKIQGVVTPQSASGGRGEGAVDKFATALLSFEAKVRAISDQKELFAHLVNDARRLLPFRQAYVLSRSSENGTFTVKAASSIPVVDRDAPMIRWVEKLSARLTGDVNPGEQHCFTIPAYCDDTDDEAKNFPFPEFCWTPLKDGDMNVGGVIFVREQPWRENELALAARFSHLYSHSWQAIRGQGKLVRKKLITPKKSLAAIVAAVIIAVIPVPITALAPVEVTPLDPFIVAAPFNGVVEEILVEQSTTVSAGQPLIAFDDIRQRNEYEVADRHAAVAQARLLRVSQTAIGDAATKRDLAVARAEYDLASAEKNYAADLLEKTTLKADQSGVVIYTDKRDWVGRPVAAGEAILQIADPSHIHFSIDLPVKESIVLEKGARVKVFLDSDPLNPLEAVLTEKSYQPRTDERNVLSYRLTASIAEKDMDRLPRIGVQGTAQVHGDKAPLIYAVLRRPLASLRQLTGF